MSLIAKNFDEIIFSIKLKNEKIFDIDQKIIDFEDEFLKLLVVTSHSDIYDSLSLKIEEFDRIDKILDLMNKICSD